MRGMGPAGVLALAAVLVVLPSPPPASAGGEKKAEPAAAPKQQEIDAAVARGVTWLKKERKRGGAIGQGPGETALALLALRHSQVPADDKVCVKAAAFLERELPDGTVYGAALGALALLMHAPERHDAKIRELVDDLVRAQCKNGQWTYAYRSTARKSGGDNSNTQFAVLALGAARAHGIDVPAEPFRKLRKFLLGSQNEDGGYGYSDKERSRSYASMTAGCAMALQFCAAGEKRLRVTHPSLADLPEVKRALAWLAKDFDPRWNRGARRAFGARAGRRSDAFWRHYWLWSLERVCAVTGRKKLGKHDWYAEGARYLLDTQRKDGNWRDPESDLRATCFALLFFGRSTQRVITPRAGKRVTTPSSKSK